MTERKLKIYEEPSEFLVDDNVKLEVKSYYADRDAPRIVSATGLGGSAGTCHFIDYLARDYHVVTFSPRNAGESNGHFTFDSYISDSAKIIDHLSQKDGRTPLGIGYSTGGYVLARLLGERALVERAILLAPLLQMSEQHHFLANGYFKFCIKTNKTPLLGLLSGINVNSEGNYAELDRQRFGLDELPSFFKSFYDSALCDKKLLSPTKVVLTGGTCFGLPMFSRELKRLKTVWEGLDAEVDIYPDINHWFSGSKWFSGVGDVFCLSEKIGATRSMEEFFKRK
ncbi:alpha/beta fold hydrolase [Candidatus Pacearchaeota archaeon]|nr:alpha/beta fold hydrolase [Candidatus Pacearchaeota archaeon]